MTLIELKNKVERLEHYLNAICLLNDICQQSVNHGDNAVDLVNCAYLLDHLLEPAMEQVELVRDTIADMLETTDSQANEVDHVPV